MIILTSCEWDGHGLRQYGGLCLDYVPISLTHRQRVSLAKDTYLALSTYSVSFKILRASGY